MKTRIDTDQGVVVHSTPDEFAYWNSAHRWHPEAHGDVYVQVTVPDDDADSDELAKGSTIDATFGYGGESAAVARKLAECLRLATEFAEEQNARQAGLIEAAKAKEEAEEAERKAAAEARAAQLEERKERLLHEFMGEKGRVRLRGYKRLRPVTVAAREVGDSYEPVLEYVFERHGYREYNPSQWARFDIKVGSRYENIWDDGAGDLNPWDRGSVKPVTRQYDGGLG